MIQPRTLGGFRDFLPEAMMPREKMIQTAQAVYRSFGFAPIDTPTLEYLEILAGKGSEETDRQLYRFQDNGGRDVGMRFDLTVPLARFAAQHIGDLGTPFKRYHIANVWRGERHQKYRYREFMQCDFDTIGSQAIETDIETALVIHELMHSLALPAFTIHINNRKVLNGVLEKLSLLEQSVPVLRALDKLAKNGADAVVREMVEQAGASEEQARRVLELATTEGDCDSVLRHVDGLVDGSELGQQGVAELREVVAGLRASGVDEKHIHLDVSIARGLDYYTGTIYETFLNDKPKAGSVCSGGRYDNLAELFTKQRLPGIGASLGLDRLLSAMSDLGMIESSRAPAPVLVVYFDASRRDYYLELASKLRRESVGVELFPEPKKLKQQLSYANRRGFRCAIIAGEDEIDRGVVQLKDLSSGTSQEIEYSDEITPVAQSIKSLLD